MESSTHLNPLRKLEEFEITETEILLVLLQTESVICHLKITIISVLLYYYYEDNNRDLDNNHHFTIKKLGDTLTFVKGVDKIGV